MANSRNPETNDALFAYAGKSEQRQRLIDAFKKYAEDEGSNVSLELFRAVKEKLEREGREW